VTPIENRESQAPTAEMLPLSLLNDFLYCSRRAALKTIEGWRSGNEHTARGNIVHDHADLPGYEVANGVTLLRALPVWSERLGLSGKCDIVEVHAQPSDGRDALPRVQEPRTSPSPRPSGFPSPPQASSPIQDVRSAQRGPPGLRSEASARQAGEGEDGAAQIIREQARHPYRAMVPVEYKRGKRRQWVNDDVQLCAQALCLEEMFGTAIPAGAIFHAESKRRREVEFTAELRAKTETTAAELHELVQSQQVPPAIFKPACEECSLYGICLPQATRADSRARQLSHALFKTD